jgi:hypothetical protein
MRTMLMTVCTTRLPSRSQLRDAGGLEPSRAFAFMMTSASFSHEQRHGELGMMPAGVRAQARRWLFSVLPANPTAS